MQPTKALSTLLLALSAFACSTPSAAETKASSVHASSAQPSSGGLQPLRHYLRGAVRAKVSELRIDPTGKMHMVETATLDERQVKEKLAGLDLDQLPNGPLVRCPSDKQIRFEDKDGRELGTIGSCSGAARFDAPGGVMGGIKAK